MADQTLKMDKILNSIGSGSTSDAEFKAYLESMNLNKGFNKNKNFNSDNLKPNLVPIGSGSTSNAEFKEYLDALDSSTQKAIPIENDISFDDRINQLSDEELGVYIDLMNIEQGDMGPNLDSEQNYNLLERILQTLGLGRSVDETRLMEGSTPKQIQEYMNEQMQGTRGTLSDMKTQIMD